MPMLQNDEPALHDMLGRQNMVTSVGNEVAECGPPCVFGVHGEWGSGKTSFLHQLHWFLIGECPEQSDAQQEAAADLGNEIRKDYKKNLISVVWFEAWRYQYEKDPIIALLHEIRTQLPLYSKWLNEGRKLAEVAIRGALLSMEDLTRRIGFSPSKVQEAGERWEREHLAVALPSHTIREHLNEALDHLLGKKKSPKRKDARLVVLIDDLDRCEPAAAFRILEGIKIYLNLPSCVFVLGMNQRIIERAIAKHTAPDEPEDSRREYAREYLEKLCTNVWHLPLIDNVLKPLGQWLPKDLRWRTEFLAVTKKHSCIAANARKIKSFANILVRSVRTLDNSDDESTAFDPKLIIFMACLYHDHHELYRMIESNTEFYDLIHRWATGVVLSDAKTRAPHELLASLRLRTAYGATDESEREATPRGGHESFPDPVRGNVFRLQSLVTELGSLAMVTVESLQKHLLSGKTRGK